MNNNDRFNKALDTDPLEAAALAIQFSGSCGSRRNAWNWAEDAVRAASSVGVVLNPGHASWPDLDAMERQLKAARAR